MARSPPTQAPSPRSRRRRAAAARRARGARGASEPAAADGEEGPILIGMNIELSGPAAVQGQAYADAGNLWVEQTNADGGILGRDVQLEIVDNRTDQTEAVTLTRQLADEGVVAMIGPGTSPTTLAAMDAILELGLPTFSMGSSEAIVTPVEEKPNVFKTPVGSVPNVEAAIRYLGEQGISTVGVIAVNNPYGEVRGSRPGRGRRTPATSSWSGSSASRATTPR